MIKEELKKEIEKEAKRRTRGFRNQENCIQSYIMGASDFVEPREKEIAKLNDKIGEQMFECAHCEDRFNANHRQYLLSQAKELIKGMNEYLSTKPEFWSKEERLEIVELSEKADQFLKNVLVDYPEKEESKNESRNES